MNRSDPKIQEFRLPTVHGVPAHVSLSNFGEMCKNHNTLRFHRYKVYEAWPLEPT